MSLFRSEAIGRLTGDPELKYVNIGGQQVAVCEFSLAVNYGFGDNEKVEFVNCTAWRKLAEAIGTYLKKGRKIYVSGHQQTRNYDKDVNGTPVKMYRTEWVLDDFDFCDSNPNAGGQAQTAAPQQTYVAPQSQKPVPF